VFKRSTNLRRGPRAASNDTASPLVAVLNKRNGNAATGAGAAAAAVADTTTGTPTATSITATAVATIATAAPAAAVHMCDGIAYPTYQEMVAAKRRRNQLFLQECGLLGAAQTVRQQHHAATKRKKRDKPQNQNPAEAQRRSRRLNPNDISLADTSSMNGDKSKFDDNRINDGAPLSLEQVVVPTNFDSLQDDSDSMNALTTLVRRVLQPFSAMQRSDPRSDPNESTTTCTTPITAASTAVAMTSLVANANNAMVAKVCPGRIHSMSLHPSRDHFIAAAGDRLGNIGLWSIKEPSTVASVTTTLHLVRPHQGIVTCLQWTPMTGCLFSSSYDGSVRWFHAATEQFEEIFAIYEADPRHHSKMGLGLEDNAPRTKQRSFWAQYACLDSRSANEKCFFASTSIGTAMHVDLRSSERITFHEALSEKKVNTLRYEPCRCDLFPENNCERNI
jgi:hypothetical protein